VIYILRRLINYYRFNKDNSGNYFNLNNPLGGGGERVDILMSDKLNMTKLDIYQLSHLKRYEFATNYLPEEIFCADLACGTGYGSILLSKKNRKVLGVDINSEVIQVIRERYHLQQNVSFESFNLLNLSYINKFDSIISFETIEHFYESDIIILLKSFYHALKHNGTLLISVPYDQKECENAKKMGFHLTFEIDEIKIQTWAELVGFKLKNYWYQNYDTHTVCKTLQKKDFLICEMTKHEG
jgi:2-polyprenyl-3-methyl-5-hydroxy-6-metoxy-1,4-benzoquinol methylase